MYDDPVSKRPTCPPPPAPPGFASWRHWVRAGCPDFEIDQPEDPAPRFSAEEPGPVKRRPRERGQLALGFDAVPADVPRRRRHRAPR
jgi:hypothetical protein